MEINQSQALLLANCLFVELVVLGTRWADPVRPHLSWTESGFVHCLFPIGKTSAFMLRHHHGWVQPELNSPEHVVSVSKMERLKTHRFLQKQVSKGWGVGTGADQTL